jgi:hypothetical protein
MAGGDGSCDWISSALIVGRRAEASRGKRRRANTLEPSVERQIEVMPALLAIGDHVQTGAELVVNGCNHCVVPHLFDIGLAKLIKVRRPKLEPSRKRVAADNGGSQRPPIVSSHLVVDGGTR